jgi:hypothetical protein
VEESEAVTDIGLDDSLPIDAFISFFIYLATDPSTNSSPR